jgi:nucleoside-diphosphate-sugar epimerase
MAEIGDPCAKAVEITKVTGKPALISRGKIEEIRQPNWLCDIAKARDLLGFEPHIFLAQGAQLTLNWYRKANWL